jgi:hypothetical protein
VFGVRRPGEKPAGRPEDGDGSGSPARTGDQQSEQTKQSKQTKQTKQTSQNKRIIVIGVATAAVVAGAIAYGVTQGSSGPSSSTGQSGHPVAVPIHVASITPATRATGVDGAGPVVVTFSGPVAANSPHPQLQPDVPGSWGADGDSMVFTPQTPFSPSSRVTVEVPAGPTGVRSATGGLLTAAVTEHFTTGAYTQLALAELLAQQGYLPMSWSELTNGATRAADPGADPASLTAAGEAYDPPAGTFHWDSGYPSTLQSLWSPDSANVVLRGAVMAFESEHGMTIDGSLTPRLWNALFRSQALGEQNQNGYTYAIASKNLPETLTIWHNGHYAMRSLANTGIPASPTVDGTFPVYERFRFTVMSGTNPDGSSYSDPVQFVSYFNGGDAVHYFPRGGYGYQQSLGCVELPYNSAEQAFPYLTYGSLVSVTG